jgi:hypothetical protein
MIPYYTSKIIFAITQHVPQEVFRQHLVRYAAFALGFALFAAGRGALFSIINNKLSRALRCVRAARLVQQRCVRHTLCSSQCVCVWRAWQLSSASAAPLRPAA